MNGVDAESQLPRLARNYLSAPKTKVESELLQGHEHNTGSPRRKRLSLRQISASVRTKIVKMAAAKTRTHMEIGEIFNVRSVVVS